jgi:hypothetical protein
VEYGRSLVGGFSLALLLFVAMSQLLLPNRGKPGTGRDPAGVGRQAAGSEEDAATREPRQTVEVCRAPDPEEKAGDQVRTARDAGSIDSAETEENRKEMTLRLQLERFGLLGYLDDASNSEPLDPDHVDEDPDSGQQSRPVSGSPSGSDSHQNTPSRLTPEPESLPTLDEDWQGNLLRRSTASFATSEPDIAEFHHALDELRDHAQSFQQDLESDDGEETITGTLDFRDSSQVAMVTYSEGFYELSWEFPLESGQAIADRCRVECICYDDGDQPTLIRASVRFQPRADTKASLEDGEEIPLGWALQVDTSGTVAAPITLRSMIGSQLQTGISRTLPAIHDGNSAAIAPYQRWLDYLRAHCLGS